MGLQAATGVPRALTSGKALHGPVLLATRAGSGGTRVGPAGFTRGDVGRRLGRLAARRAEDGGKTRKVGLSGKGVDRRIRATGRE